MGMDVSVLLQSFITKLFFFHVMGKALSGELSCTQTCPLNCLKGSDFCGLFQNLIRLILQKCTAGTDQISLGA